MSGVNLKSAGDNRHVVRSNDGKTALWIGAIDDLWELGKPVGAGGPWLESAIKADEYSDPYLMTGYDQKVLEISSSDAATISAEVDVSGRGDWHVYKTFRLEPEQPIKHEFPRAFQAYWIRFKSDTAADVTAQLFYR